MKIEVNTQKPYSISIHNNNFTQFASILKPYIKSNIVIIFDQNIKIETRKKITQSFLNSEIIFNEIVLEKVGEEIKTMKFFAEFCENLLSNFNITRKTTLIAIGGGTIGDFIGFVASTIMRGIHFIQIPTTLLSMVDSSIGGKVAVNAGKFKNAIGSFYQPKHVLIDIAFLKTLPKIEILSGYAEVLKYGLIASKNFYDYLLSNENIFFEFIKSGNIENETEKYLMNIISQSCKIKADVVCQDEFETKNIREILNFGHTFGHAFEGIFLGKIPHGIAVAIGMICALKFSNIPTNLLEIHYKKIGLYTTIQEFCTQNNLQIPHTFEILNLMKKDKKNNDHTQIKLILLSEIGKTKILEIPAQEILSFLTE